MRRSVAWIAALLILSACAARPPVPVAAPAPPRDVQAAFVEAHADWRAGDNSRTLPALRQLVDAYPQLADYCLYMQGTAAQRLGQPADAETAFARLLREFPPSVHAPAARLALGQLRLDAGRLDEARELLDTVVDTPDSETARDARLALAEVDERTGDLDAAQAELWRVRRNAAGSATGRAAKARLQSLRTRYPALRPTGANLLDEGRLLLAERDFAAAEAAAATVLTSGEGPDRLAALRLQADAQFAQGQVDAAVATLRQVVDTAPTSDAAPEALFRMATILWNMDRDAPALDAFEELRRRYPRHARVPEAIYAIGRIHQQAGRSAAAIAAYDELAQRDPSNKLAAEARWRIGWIHYGQRNWTTAADAFARVGARDEGAYWQARALEHDGQPAAARALYHDLVRRNPTGYYAMWAEERLDAGSKAPLVVTGPRPRVTSPTRDIEPDDASSVGARLPADTFHLARADELRRIGLPDLARRELRAVERTHGHDSAVLGYLVRTYPSAHGYADALRVMRQLGTNSALSPARRDRVLYPLAFWPAVSREADGQSLDPLLVLGLMRQESLFDPTARSPADARGLMQLLPSTAARVAAAGLPDGPPPDLYDPTVNIRLGTRYLRDLLDRYGGDALKSVAAYNGGETAVDRWQRQFGDRDPDEFVESITYRETRDYVKRVVANYRAYQQLYARGDH
jgi:soluble lytic murein transglycosylase